jgi:hypothetical protein
MATADWAEFHEGQRKRGVTVGAELFHHPRTSHIRPCRNIFDWFIA